MTLLLNSLINSNNVLVGYVVQIVRVDTQSANKDGCTSSFPICVHLTRFSGLTALVKLLG